MGITIKRLRFVLLIAAVTVSVGDLRNTLYAFPDDCAEICPSSDCNTQCYENAMEFENGNMISCRTYGVYDTSQMCCGDSVCDGATGETPETCYSDCYVPPVGPQRTYIVNGSLNPTMPDWMATGSPLFNAIADTYGGQAPIQFFWSQNSLGEVTWPGYTGFQPGAEALAAEVNSSPLEGDLNLVAHSHGGNVLILATPLLNWPVKHLIELGTPVNWLLTRHTSGLGVQWRCTASSWSDDVQFYGASPLQVGGYFSQLYLAAQFWEEAWVHFNNQDWEQYGIAMALFAAATVMKNYYWDSTKVEHAGSTIAFDYYNHATMHEPVVWHALPSYCKVGG